VSIGYISAYELIRKIKNNKIPNGIVRNLLALNCIGIDKMKPEKAK